MRTRIALAAASLIALSFVARPASAQGTKTICNDGTTSEAVGRGACSSHGGVKTMGTKSATKTAKSEAKAAEKTAEKTAKTETKAAEKTAKTETKAAVKTAKTETKAVEKKAKAAPKEVTCTDGTMSKPGRGACSGHGGVKKG